MRTPVQKISKTLAPAFSWLRLGAFTMNRGRFPLAGWTGCGGHVHPVSADRSSLAVGLDDVRAVSSPLKRSAAFLRVCNRVAGLAHRDDLAIPSPQAEPELAGLVLVHRERACDGGPFHWLLGIGKLPASAKRIRRRSRCQ